MRVRWLLAMMAAALWASSWGLADGTGGVERHAAALQTTSRDLTQRPLAWFAPLPPMPTSAGRPFLGSSDFMSLFNPDAPWQAAAARIQVFKLYGEWVGLHATDAQLRQVIADLNRRGIALAVEAGPLEAPSDCGAGVEGFAGIAEGRRIIDRIKAAGGTIDLIAMDEPYYYGHFYDGPQACHWSAQKIAQEVGDFVHAMKSLLPGVVIGDIEPLAGAANDQAYVAWLDAFRQVNGYDLAFLHLDMDWSRPRWTQEALAIQAHGGRIGVPVGIIYTGNAFDKTDEAWLSAAGERVKKYELQANGQPDHVLFQSWNDKPDRVLPETQPYTFTNFIDMYFADKASLGYRTEGPGANLALRKPVSVSNQISDLVGALAVDGDLGTLWNSGDGPTQWIQIDLGAAYGVREIRLTTAQFPVGKTIHRVLGKEPGAGASFRLFHTFEGNTEDGQTLIYTFPQPIQGLQFIQVETTVSPSWVAWREIEIIASQ